MQKGRLWGPLIAAFQHLKGDYKKTRERLFTRSCCDMTRANGFKLKEHRLRLDRRKKFCTMSVEKHWNRFPSKLVEASPLETFKIRIELLAT